MKKEDTNHPKPPEETTHKSWLEQLGTPMAEKKFWNTDKFLSLLAFLISLV